MPENLPNKEAAPPAPTLETLAATIFASPDTTENASSSLLLGNGIKTTYRDVSLEGWHDFIAPPYDYNGRLQLQAVRTETYRWGRLHGTAESYSLGYAYSAVEDGRTGGGGFSLPVDIKQPVDEHDLVTQLLLSHLQHKEKRENNERIRAAGMAEAEQDRSQPYQLAYKPDMELEPGVHEKPWKIIRDALENLMHGAEHGNGCEHPEHEASYVLATLKQVTGEALETYDITQQELDALVRANFRHQAVAKLTSARAHYKFADYGGVIPLKDDIEKVLWKAGLTPADIGTSTEELTVLDRECAFARAQFAIGKLKTASLYPATTPETINEYRAVVRRAAEYLDMTFEELGITSEEYAAEASIVPTGLGALIAKFKW